MSGTLTRREQRFTLMHSVAGATSCPPACKPTARFYSSGATASPKAISMDIWTMQRGEASISGCQGECGTPDPWTCEGRVVLQQPGGACGVSTRARWCSLRDTYGAQAINFSSKKSLARTPHSPAAGLSADATPCPIHSLLMLTKILSWGQLLLE